MSQELAEMTNSGGAMFVFLIALAAGNVSGSRIVEKSFSVCSQSCAGSLRFTASLMLSAIDVSLSFLDEFYLLGRKTPTPRKDQNCQ